MERLGALSVASKGISVVDGRKVATLLLSITGERLPNGEPDVDVQGEFTNHIASKSAAERWINEFDGRVQFDHLGWRPDGRTKDEELWKAGYVGNAKRVMFDNAGTETFAEVKTEQPLIVRMVERGVPIQASWHGPYDERMTAAKSAAGKPAKEVFPVYWDEVSLILEGYPGAARKRSKLIAAKAANLPEEENMEPEVKAVMDAYEALTPEQKAACMAAMKPEEKKEEPPADGPPIGEKSAMKLIAESEARIMGAVKILSEEFATAATKIGEKAAIGIDAARFDSQFAALSSRSETLEKSLGVIGESVEKIAKRPAAPPGMPATRDIGSKAADDFGARDFTSKGEVLDFAESLAATLPAAHAAAVRRMANEKIIGMSRS